jgi:hypothetical protein
LDDFHEACEELTDEMESLLAWLQTLMVKRARFRKSHRRLTLARVEINHVSETTFRRLSKRSRFEQRTSETLNTIQARYNDLNDSIQMTLGKYFWILGYTTQSVESAEFEEAIDALHDFESETATFRNRVKSLLRTVYMSDSKAWDHFMGI